MPAGSTRRSVLEAVAVSGASLAAAVGIGPATADQADDDEWAQYQSDPGNTGHAPDSWGPTGSARERWRIHTDDSGVSSPVVVNGTLYVGDAGGAVHAINVATGETAWTRELPEAVSGPPAVVDGTVYVTSKDRYLYALDAGTGDEQWSAWARSSIPHGPTVADNRVYFGNGSDHSFLSFDGIGGSQNWRYELNDVITSQAAVLDRTVYFASERVVYALDSFSGEERWVEAGSGQVAAAPTVSDGTVYLGGLDGQVYARNAETGEQEWSFETGDAVQLSSAVVDGTVYVASDDGSVYALDAATGDREWAFELDGKPSSDPVVAGGTVYVGSHGRTFYALDATTGTLRWERDGPVIDRAPAIVGDSLYAVDSNGVLIALEAASTPMPSSTPTATTTTTPSATTTDDGQAGDSASSPATDDDSDLVGGSGGLSFGAILSTLGIVVLVVLLALRRLTGD